MRQFGGNGTLSEQVQVNQHVLMQGLDTPAPSESLLLPPKRYPRPPNETRRKSAFNACVEAAKGERLS